MPPFVELTVPVVLGYVPEEAEVTLTEMAQPLPVAIVPPLSVRLVSPGFGENVPPHVFVAFVGEATWRLAGNGSVTAKPVCAWVLNTGLPNVKVRVEAALTAMLVGLKTLEIVGGSTTVKFAEAVLLVPLLVVVTVPVVFVFGFVPAEVAVMVAETAQFPEAGIVPPVKLMEVAFAVAVNVPPQVLVAFGVPATVMPVGNVSVTAAPVAGSVFGLVRVRVTVVVPPTGMLVAVKALEIVGTELTVKVADAGVPVPPFVEVGAPVVLL